MNFNLTPTSLIDQLRAWFHPKDRSVFIAEDCFIDMDEQAKPGTNPAAGRDRLYPKAGNNWYVLDSAGTETLLGGGSGLPVHTHNSASQGGQNLEDIQTLTANNYADIGSTTLAKKFGNIYLGPAKDLYPDNDGKGLWNRTINFGLAPIEHWHQAADDIAWTGYAAYTGWGTPNTVSYFQSVIDLKHTAGAIKFFRYRSYVNAQTSLYARCAPRANGAVGVMVDDGVDNADGNGANNFCRCLYAWGASTTMATITVEYRTGGGAVTSNSYLSLYPFNYFAVGLTYGTGTRWTNWGTNFFATGETGTGLLATASGLTWTPARIGIIGRNTGTSTDHLFDWYHEA